MSLYQRHIKSQSTINYEEPYAFSKPTTAAFISTETMETNAEKKSVRQTSQNVHAKPGLAEIRKQKDRRKRRVLLKLWKAKQLAFLRRRYENVI